MPGGGHSGEGGAGAHEHKSPVPVGVVLDWLLRLDEIQEQRHVLSQQEQALRRMLEAAKDICPENHAAAQALWERGPPHSRRTRSSSECTR